jgi:hypothetical protein
MLMVMGTLGQLHAAAGVFWIARIFGVIVEELERSGKMELLENRQFWALLGSKKQ